jgi:hypothetical protein
MPKGTAAVAAHAAPSARLKVAWTAFLFMISPPFTCPTLMESGLLENG